MNIMQMWATTRRDMELKEAKSRTKMIKKDQIMMLNVFQAA